MGRRIKHVAMTSALLMFAALSFPFLTGCSGTKDPYARQAVSGMVTFNGQPLGSGAITFFPENNGPVASGAPIVDGKYSISQKEGLPPGPYKVSISSPIAKNQTKPDPTAFPEYQEQIPKEYNSQTSLTCDVQPGSTAEISFDLVSPSK